MENNKNERDPWDESAETNESLETKKSRKSRKRKKESQNSAPRVDVKRGTISAAFIAIGIAICIILILIVYQIPTNVSEADLSTEKIYTVSDTSVEFLEELEDDIVITALVQDGDLDSRISKFLDNYCALSSHVSWQQIDPVKYPSALTTYEAEEGEFVVTDETTGESEIIDTYDILVYDLTYYYYYGTLYYTEFDAEGQFTSAINRLISDNTKLIYLTEGHGEGELSDSVLDLLGKSLIETSTVNLLTEGEIPEDCDGIIVMGPTSDFAEDEVDLLEEYLEEGGQVTILLNYEGTDLTNLETLLETYGVTIKDGYVAETTQGYMYQNNYYMIFPEIANAVTGITSDLTSDITVLLYVAQGLETVDPERDTITVQTLLSTSEDAIITDSEGNEVEEGEYALATISSEEIDDDTTSRLTVYSTDYIIDETLTSVSSSLANESIFVNAITVGFDDIENLSIEAKSLETTYNTITPWLGISLVFIIVIPLALVAVGLVIWARRRKK